MGTRGGGGEREERKTTRQRSQTHLGGGTGTHIGRLWVFIDFATIRVRLCLEKHRSKVRKNGNSRRRRREGREKDHKTEVADPPRRRHWNAHRAALGFHRLRYHPSPTVSGETSVEGEEKWELEEAEERGKRERPQDRGRRPTSEEALERTSGGSGFSSTSLPSESDCVWRNIGGR